MQPLGVAWNLKGIFRWCLSFWNKWSNKTKRKTPVWLRRHIIFWQDSCDAKIAIFPRAICSGLAVKRLGLQLGDSTAAFVVDCFNYSLKDSASAKTLQLELDLTDSLWSNCLKDKSHMKIPRTNKKHARGAKTAHPGVVEMASSNEDGWLHILRGISEPRHWRCQFHANWVSSCWLLNPGSTHANIESSIGRSPNHPPRVELTLKISSAGWNVAKTIVEGTVSWDCIVHSPSKSKKYPNT